MKKITTDLASLAKDWQQFKQPAVKSTEVAPIVKRHAQSPETANSQDFKQAVKGVTPLKTRNNNLASRYKRSVVKAVNPVEPPVAKQPALSDQLDVNFYLSNYEGKLGFVRLTGEQHLIKKLHNGFWPVKNKLDLHGLTLDQARTTFVNWLVKCYNNSWRCVLVVHGSGWDAKQPAPLATAVKSWALQLAEVLAFIQAPEELGAKGATLILLTKKSLN